MKYLAWIKPLVHITFLSVLVSCAFPSATPNVDTPSAQPTSRKATGKLSARLEMLAQSPTLRTANANEQARALGLPVQGAGSLMRDEQGRLLVNIRSTDLSANAVQSLRDAGAVVTNVSERYQTITAFVSPGDLAAIANLPMVQSVQEELTPAGGGGAVFPTPP